MNNKFLYFKRRQLFDTMVSSFPEGLNPLCFIEDTNEIWFNNHFFLSGHESIKVSEMDNTVTVSLSESYFRIVPGSTSILVRAYDDNTLIISSNALTKIDALDELEWKENKLFHKESGIDSGTYGPQSDAEGANIIKIPKISFNKYGHAISADNINITIRDYVEQRSSDELDSVRLLLLAERSSNNNDTNITRKGKGLTYNNYTLVLKAGALELSGTLPRSLVVKQGDLIVESGVIIGQLLGEVTGTATPKIHLSTTGEYGGASKNLYGHVKLVDTISGLPQPSSDNLNVNSANVVAEAASPYLVYNYVNANKFKVGGINANKRVVESTERIDFTDDFVLQDNKVSIGWLEL